MNKKVSICLLAVIPLALVACGETATSNNNAAYAGYSVDLNGDGTIGDSEKNLTWANSYDKIISTIKSTTDSAQRYTLMHAAETELMSTGTITPIYYYTDLFLKKDSMTGFYASPLGYKFFQNATLGSSSEFTVCLASKPGTIDPALNSTVDGATYDSQLFEGLYKWGYTGNYPDGELSLVPGIATGYTKTANADGTETYSFALQSGLKFSDGTAYNANDIVRSWKRAVSSSVASDYAYMFEVINGGADAEGETDGASLDVTAPDANTVQVVLNNDVPYFLELTAFPAYFPVPSAADVGGNWATSASTLIGNGPLKLTSYDPLTSLVMEKNANYYDPDSVKATKITFAFSDDTNSMLTSYEAGSYAFIDDMPTEDLAGIKAKYGTQFFDVGQLGTYYLSWNINDTTFNAVADTEEKRETFRKALGLLIDRNYVVSSISKGGEEPANGFVSAGLTGPNQVGEYVDHNGPDEDGKGWYSTADADYDSNVATAIADLKSIGYTYDETKKVFTDIPSFDYLYNTSTTHKAIAEYLQQAFAKYGITMKLASQEWATFVATRKSGDYTLARNGWLCDYNDPISMLDMWISTSGNNDIQLGKA